MQDVYKMPPPIKDDPDCLMQDFRIPAPTPQPNERLDINAVSKRNTKICHFVSISSNDIKMW